MPPPYVLLHRHRNTEQPPEEEQQEQEPQEQNDSNDASPLDRKDSDGPPPKNPPQGRGKDQNFAMGNSFKVADFGHSASRQTHKGFGKRTTGKSAGKMGCYVYSIQQNLTGDLALDATIRAAAPYQLSRDKKGLALSIRESDIREKVRQRKYSNLLVFGEKGTAKSTAVRALTRLLPEIDVIKGCPFHCNPDNPEEMCDECYHRYQHGEVFERETIRMPVVDLPVSATEDRVVGSLDIEAAIQSGKKKFEPGVLAMANRGILYVDEINILDDHIVDLLLDSAAMGTNTIEREGISFSHPAKFILVGTMNPEEGELRPQLLDRFGLSVEIKGITDPVQRVQIVRLRGEYEEDPKAFVERYHEREHQLCHKIEDAMALLPKVQISDDILLLNAKLSIAVEVDGHRSDLTLMKTEKTLAAIRGKTQVTKEEVREVARMVFLHRTRMLPFVTSRKLDMDKLGAIIDGEKT